MPVVPYVQRVTPFHDRSRRLAVFGGIAVLIGAGCVMLALAQLALYALSRDSAMAASDPAQIFLGVTIYLLLGACFAAVGVGSLQRRRWAPRLMLVLAWSWLLGGLLLVVLAPGLVDGVLPADSFSQGVRRVARTVATGAIAVFGVLLPLAFVWVYRSRDVEHTCRAHDPRPAWTERCPTSVLGLSLGMAAMAALVLLSVVRPVVPWFGHLVTGWPGALLTLAMGLACAYLAWSTYRQRPDGWWGSTLLLAGLGATTAVTVLRREPAEWYRALGYPRDQIEMLGAMGLLNGMATALVALLITLATVVYMLSVRRHFRRGSPQMPSADSSRGP